MERRMTGNCHVRCGAGENSAITSKSYLSLFGSIPKFEKLIATIRSREISASIILQAQSQLKAIYKDNADTIVGNCDTTLFLGGKETTTLKALSEVLGKETIDSFNTSETRGKELSHGMNYQKLGKELMAQNEIAVMDGAKCILQLRGVHPFLSNKYDLMKHPNIDFTADSDKQHTFDVEKYLRKFRKGAKNLKFKGDQIVEVYDLDKQILY
jgi:type IV secretion system protein VirD4